jgi:hypothetical protein
MATDTGIYYDSSQDPDYLAEVEANDAENLQIGEQMEQAQQELLAGKFTDAAELERAYLELQSKLGKGEPAEPETVEEEVVEGEEEGGEFDIVQRLIDENGQYSEETIEALNNLTNEEVADLIREAHTQNQETTLSPQEEEQFKDYVGGPEAYDQLTQWAAENWTPQEIELFNAVTASGNPQAIWFAVKALNVQYRDAVGSEGKLVTGRRTSPSTNVFRSQAEVVRAMADPRYDSDPAYRQDVFDKLERSSFDD